MSAKIYDSVPRNFFQDALYSFHPTWNRNTEERTITVYDIIKLKTTKSHQDIELHFSIIPDDTGKNVIKFHFTVRIGVDKGNDAFKWYKVMNHNENASFIYDNIAGSLDLSSDDIPDDIRTEIKDFDDSLVKFQELVQKKCRKSKSIS